MTDLGKAIKIFKMKFGKIFPLGHTPRLVTEAERGGQSWPCHPASYVVGHAGDGLHSKVRVWPGLADGGPGSM